MGGNTGLRVWKTLVYLIVIWYNKGRWKIGTDRARRDNIKFNKYTNTEIDKLLENIVILIDTREKANIHIIEYLEDKNIKYKKRKLDHGDYSCYLEADKELGIYRDMYFIDTISIERKASLEELSGNLTQDRQRFENELIRSKGKLILLIENSTYEDIILGNYKTKYNPLSFIASLKTYEARYSIETNFINNKFTGNFINMTLRYHVREILKHGTLGQAI